MHPDRRTFLTAAGVAGGAPPAGGPPLGPPPAGAPARAANGLYVAETAVDLGPCVTRPEKIICVGLNYRRHAAEVGQPVPAVPILFNKYNSALAGHRATINVSQQPAEKFDYEVELVVAMGKTARNVGPADALSHVFGYCTGNDLTARDLQART